MAEWNGCYCGEFAQPTIAPDEFGETCFHEHDKCEVPTTKVPDQTVIRLLKQKVDALTERAEKAEADALVLIANNETLQREAKDAWRRVDEYARIVQRVVGVCEDKYVGPPTEYGQGFQEGYNDALGVVQAALRSPRPGRRQR